MKSFLVLLFLTCMQACNIILTAMSKQAGKYSSETLVLFGEVAKIVLSLVMREATKDEKVHGLRLRALIPTKGDLIPLIFLSGLYVVQNNLQLVAIANLNPLVYQSSNQLRILTATLFGAFMFNKKISQRKWIAVCTLVVGVALVQTSNTAKSGAAHGGDQFIGLVAIIGACLTSGYAGNFCERFLKVQMDIWSRNIQIALASLPIAAAPLLMHGDLYNFTLFKGFTPLVWTVVVVQALTGIGSSLAMKYVDNNAKAFATAIGIVLSSWISVFVFEISINLQTVLGTVLVSAASMAYSINPAAAKVAAH